MAFSVFMAERGQDGAPVLSSSIEFNGPPSSDGHPTAANLEEMVLLAAALRCALSSTTRHIFDATLGTDETELARLREVYRRAIRTRTHQEGRVFLRTDNVVFIDVACESCGGSFGWLGTHRDRPRCPHCSYRPMQEELDKLQAAIEAQAGKMVDEDRGRRLVQRRRAAGLTMRSACDQLGVTALLLSRWESGWKYPDSVAAKFDQVYGSEVSR